jgi:hypothetical protein
VVSAALVGTQRCGKHISAALNQHGTIEEAVSSELSSGDNSCSRELRESPELAVGRIMARKVLSCTKKTSCMM